MRLIIIIGLIVNFTFADWNQDKFAIVAWWDPDLVGTTATDEAALTRFVNGGFNLLGGNGNSYNHTFNSATISNNYLLSRVSAVNTAFGWTALRAIVSEPAFTVNPVNVTNYTGLTGGLATGLYGYGVIHEPTASVLSSQLLAVNSIRNADPNRFTYDVMASIWRVWDPTKTFSVNWTSYQNYVNTYVNNTSTRVAMFDYYLISEISGATTYRAQGADRVNYYATQALFAQSTTNANKTFWGFAEADDEQIDWNNPGPLLHEHFPYPTASYLRFNAFSNIIYGAKGINWYTYQKPNTTCIAGAAGTNCETFNWTASNNSDVYNQLSYVNKDLASMGPTLMRLNWLTTVHGTSQDPYSLETNLPTVNASTPVLVNEAKPQEIAIGIHKHKDNGRNYLTFLNKNWQGSPITRWFSVKGFDDLFLFNKSNSNWQRIPNTISYAGTKTAFGVDFNPGDIQLVDVRADVISPLHQYWNASATSHYYTSNYEGSSNCCGWNYEQTIGGVYKTQQAGTVPIYEYFNSAATDFYYTTQWQGPNNCCGWTYQNTIIGYAFNTQQPGTVPIYEYWNASLSDHYYTTTWQGNDNGHGWTYQNNILGYIIPNN